jgi:uncharacterized protein (DUF1330 family)
MSVLIVGTIAVDNPANLGPYKAAAGASMKEFGIGVIASAAPTPMLEGELPGTITAVLTAESEEQARAWFASESYAKAIAARSPDSKFTIAIVPRVD